MSLGVFSLVKNEVQWIGFSILSMKDLVNEWVYFDGGSTDGTLDILDYLRTKYGLKIKIFMQQDPKDLNDDYVRLFNECLYQVESDYAWFCHPDMIMISGPKELKKGPMAYYTNMSSFTGNPGKEIKRLISGRTDKWKNIMIKDFGLHYFGHYGAQNEDMYFSEITGDEHKLFSDFEHYPYKIDDSGIYLNHYSDVRPYGRRLSRMMTCLKNQGYVCDDDELEVIAADHPRVSLEPNSKYGKFEFEDVSEFPTVFNHAHEFAKVLGKPVTELCYLPIQEDVSNV